MIEQMPAGVAVVDARDARVQLANRHFHMLLNEPHRSAPVTGRTLAEVIPGADRLDLGRWIKQVLVAGRPVTRKDVRLEGMARGLTCWDITATPLPGRPGSAYAVMLHIVDTTDTVRLRAEHDRLLLLAEQRAEMFGVATETLSEGIVVVDGTGRIRRVNHAAIAMLDLEIPELSAADERRPLSPPKVSPDTSSRLRLDLMPLRMALLGQLIRDYEQAVRRRDGETTWLRISSAPLYDRHGNIRGAVAGLQDVSQSRRVDQIKEDFLAVTAHELRTPVTALLGYTHLMVRRAQQAGWADRDLHALRMIETQAHSLTQLINGLIDVSRLQMGAIELRCQTLDLCALVRQTVSVMQLSAVEHTLVVEAPEAAITVWGDPQRLDQILSHLVGNAVKYSPWGGVVRVRLWTDDQAHVAITDTGIGIPEEALPQLFQRFYRATNVDADRISGLGVGLYLVKELIESHGGQIGARSTPDEGTTFEITLPLHPTAGQAEGH